MNKYIISLLALASVFTAANGQSPSIDPSDRWSDAVFGNNHNAVVRKTYIEEHTAPSLSGYNASVTYYDNLGYPEQQIEVGASPDGKHIITHLEHDYLGRVERSYLPFTFEFELPEPGTPGYGNIFTPPTIYRSDVNSGQAAWYTARYGAQESARAFSEREYESSVRGVPILETIPGLGTEHSTTMKYSVNIQESIPVIALDAESMTITVSGTHPDGSLYKHTVIDADGRQVTVFSYGTGRKYLERRLITETSFSIEYADTYYLYDGLNRLRVVVSPEGAARLEQGQSYAPTTAVMQEYCYLYRYDHRDRIVEKKIPGREAEYMVYDRGNKIVLTQDGNLRPTRRWLFSAYDQFDRFSCF